MPIKIGMLGDMSEDEFVALARAGKWKAANPQMEELLDWVESGQPLRVPLEEGQSARGLRVAISRAANGRGLSVATVEGAGFVAVRKADEPRTRKAKPAPTGEGPRRRGRPPKRQEQDAAEVASLQQLASQES